MVHRYRVHGLLVACDKTLPIPGDRSLEPPDVEVCLTAQRVPHSAVRHTRQDDPDDPWVREHWTVESSVVVEFPGWASFEIDKRRVTLLDDETDDADLVTHLLLDHVLPRLVALRGDLMLHASGAVGASGRAHLFLGVTGTGKSTLATALAAAGWALLDDDGVRVIQPEPGGPWFAVPGYEGVRLLPEAAAAVVPGLTAQRPMFQGSRKARYPVDGVRLALADQPAPLGMIYCVERRDAVGAPTVAALGFAQGMSELLRHGFHLAGEPAALTRRAFERSAAVAAANPVCRLELPDGLAALDAAVRALVEVDAGLLGPPHRLGQTPM